MESPESPKRRPLTYQEYKSLCADITGSDLAHYYNNELVSLTTNAELTKVKIENSALNETEKRELLEHMNRVLAGFDALHEIANDAFRLIT